MVVLVANVIAAKRELSHDIRYYTRKIECLDIYMQRRVEKERDRTYRTVGKKNTIRENSQYNTEKSVINMGRFKNEFYII